MTDPNPSRPNGASSAIRPDMTVLDIVSQYRATQDVFKQWDDKAGECICCNALFEPLKAVAEKYSLDLDTLTRELETATKQK